MKTKLSLLVAVFCAATATAKEKDATSFPTEKFGVTDLGAHELVSRVSIVTLGGKTEPLLRELVSASKTKEPLAVDSSFESPVWMFGAPMQTRVSTSAGPCKLRLEFLGLDGTSSAQLSDVVRPAHLVVLVVDGKESKEEIDAALKTLRKQMRPDRADQLVTWTKRDGKSLLATLVKTIQTGKLPAQ